MSSRMQAINIDYTGIAELAPEFVQIFAGAPDAKTIPFGLSGEFLK